MNSTVSVAVSAVGVFVLSSVWYARPTPVEEKVPPVTATLHAGDWLLKLVVISVIVGLWL